MTTLTAEGGSAGATAATWRFGYDVAGRRTSTTLPAATGLLEKRGYDDAGRLTSDRHRTHRRGRAGRAGPGLDVRADPRRGRQPDPGGHHPRRRLRVGGLRLRQGRPGHLGLLRGGELRPEDAKPAGRIDYTLRPGRQPDQPEAHRHRRRRHHHVRVRRRRPAGPRGGPAGPRPRPARPSTTTTSTATRPGPAATGSSTTWTTALAKATVAGRTTTFAYDADGLRLTATTDAGPAGAAATQRWSWDVAGTLPQIASTPSTDAAGTVVEKRGFTYGPDDEPLALLDPATGAHAYTHDWLGGVANMLSPTGTPERGLRLRPVRQPARRDHAECPGRGQRHCPGAEQARPAPENPLQFTGAYQDSTTGSGNYYLRARNYDPGTGRFTSRRPDADRRGRRRRPTRTPTTTRSPTPTRPA